MNREGERERGEKRRELLSVCPSALGGAAVGRMGDQIAD